MKSNLKRGCEGGRKNEMLSDVGGGGSERSGRPIFIFLLKKIGFVS